MEKGQKMVLEQVVTTIASVADTAEEKFAAYYERSVVFRYLMFTSSKLLLYSHNALVHPSSEHKINVIVYHNVHLHICQNI